MLGGTGRIEINLMKSAHTRTWLCLSCFGALSLSLVPEAHAHIYKCRGKGGTVHYTNVKVRGGRCVLAVKGSRPARRKTAPKVQNKVARNDRKTSSFPSQLIHPGTVHIGQAGKCENRPYGDYVRGAASLYSLPEPFLRAVMRVESRCNPKALSPKGAMGLMQLMPQTATAMGVTNPYDPRQNIYGGARYLRILANRFQGNITLTAAAYNAGSGAVQRYGGIPPYEETQRYVRKVIHHFYAAR